MASRRQKWNESFEALSWFIADNDRSPRHDSTDPAELRLYRWMTRQRSAARTGRLDDGQRETLAYLGGWTWGRGE